MTPLPRPTPTLRRMRLAPGEVPMTAAQYLRWRARRSRPEKPMAMPTVEWMEAQMAHSAGRPFWRDVVEAAGDGEPKDEIDAAYLAAIRLAPRVVGTADGQVPLKVADRLYDAGLIRKQE